MARQKAITKDTEELEQLRKKALSTDGDLPPDFEVRCEQLAVREFNLATEIKRARKPLLEEDNTGVFSDVLAKLRVDLRWVGRKLKRVQTGASVNAAQQEIQTALHNLNSSSTANQLLEPFGLAIDRCADAAVTFKGDADTTGSLPSLPLEEAFPVAGGTPFVWLDGKPVATWVRHGKGMVVVLGFGSRFSDAKMGVTADVIPDKELGRVYEFEYALLRSMIDDNLPSR